MYTIDSQKIPVYPPISTSTYATMTASLIKPYIHNDSSEKVIASQLLETSRRASSVYAVANRSRLD